MKSPKPPPSRLEDLTAIDIAVMEALTTSRTTVSSVALAATVWNPDSWDMGADPVGLVQMVVESLGERGLVTYHVHERGPQGMEPRPWTGLAHTIRLSQMGWTLMGYPHIHLEAGRRMSSGMVVLDPHGDRTDHRKHGKTAEGGAIERDTFPEHRARFPHHVHPLMEDDDMAVAASPKLAPTDDDNPTRGYIKVTPDLEAAVIAYKTRFPLSDYAELGSMLGLPERTVRYVLTDLPRLRATGDAEAKAGNIKQRILWILDALPMENVPELRRVLGRADTEHDIVHALHDLHKQGKVDFTEKGSRKEPINIHLTARGKGEGLPKVVKDRIHEDFKDQPFVAQAVADAELDAAEGAHTVKPNAETPAVVGATGLGVNAVATAEPTTEVEAEPTPDTEYPLLTALIERERERVRADNTYFKFSEAADLIREADPDTAAMLDQKARNHDIAMPSPIEAEYLRFFRSTPMKVVGRE